MPSIETDNDEAKVISLSVTQKWLNQVERLKAQLSEAGVTNTAWRRKNLNRSEVIRLVVSFVEQQVQLAELAHYAKQRAKYWDRADTERQIDLLRQDLQRKERELERMKQAKPGRNND
tara:strand:+ start:274 stop:627 length:354 start_codon:yes stop_codon:yes gene_type:complete